MRRQGLGLGEKSLRIDSYWGAGVPTGIQGSARGINA